MKKAIQDQILLKVEELEERIAPSGIGNPGNNNPPLNNTNNPGNNNPPFNNTNNPGNEGIGGEVSRG